jgi:hypothetical protein
MGNPWGEQLMWLEAVMESGFTYIFKNNEPEFTPGFGTVRENWLPPVFGKIHSS